MPTGKLTSFGLKAVDSDKWDGNIRRGHRRGRQGWAEARPAVQRRRRQSRRRRSGDELRDRQLQWRADSEAATTVVKLGFFTMKKIDKQHNGIGGALFSVSDSGGNAVVFEKGSANGSWSVPPTRASRWTT